MAGVHTQKGAPCPICQKFLTTHVALLPFKGQNPHTYAVCPDCYCKQWALSEGEDVPCPLKDYLRTPVEEAPLLAPKKEEKKPPPPEPTKIVAEVPLSPAKKG